ncbi:MAG: hypothetical protein WAV07_10865 [Candidatus Contendobacter sp.]
MRNMIRGFRNFNIYLLPTFLLAAAGALLMGLLYYPALSTHAAGEHQIIAGAAANDWQTHADDLFVVMLADALRQIQAERENQARTLIYRYENDARSAEKPAMLPMAPPSIENGCVVDRPVLIHL